MRIILVILCACCLATGCGDTPQPPKPSPLHYVRIGPRQCALSCCRCKHRPVARAVPARKHQPHSQ